jgi:hypothetical protein
VSLSDCAVQAYVDRSGQIGVRSTPAGQCGGIETVAMRDQSSQFVAAECVGSGEVVDADMLG